MVAEGVEGRGFAETTPVPLVVGFVSSLGGSMRDEASAGVEDGCQSMLAGLGEGDRTLAGFEGVPGGWNVEVGVSSIGIEKS